MRHHLLVGTALAIVATATPAFAQTAPKPDDSNVADIVVTAQKRTERLQDIPVSASVLSSTALAQAHITDLSDINRVVPSVQLKGTFNGRVPYGIRGISTNANEGAIGLTSGVSIQVDGVPVPADSFAANTISDVAQLEVLKGPQATLGGRTASAGVINFVTYSPTRTVRGGATVVVTEDGERRGDAHVSGPLGEALSYSVAGYASRTPYPVRNLTLGIKSHATSVGVRGKLKFAPSTSFDATLMGHYALSKSRGENFVPQYFTPGATLFPFIPSAFDANGVPTQFGITQAVGFPGYTIRYGNTRYASPVDMSSRYQDSDGSLGLNFYAGDLTLSSLTSYFREKQFQSQDIFESNVFFFDVLTGGNAPHFGNIQTATGQVTQTTQEFKVASDATKPINFIAGAFYSDMKVDQTGLRVWVANPASKRNISTTKNSAIYARVTARLSEQFSVIGGLRYNHDKIGWDLTQYFDPAQGQFQGCGGPVECHWVLSNSSNALVGDLSVQFRPSRDVMVYGSYTRGYKPKAFNTVHDFTSTQAAPSLLDRAFIKAADQEKIDSFELGLKSRFNRNLTFNAALFHTEYNGYQAQTFDNSAVIGTLVLANAGAKTQGIEADLNYATQFTRLSIAGAYIDAKFTRFPGATCYLPNAPGCVNNQQDLSGRPLPDSPKVKLSASGEQTIPMGGLNLLVGGNVSYRSSALFQANGNPQTRQPGFALLDASLGFQSKDEKLTLTFFVNNITDHFYLTNAEDFFSGATGTFTGFGPGGPIIAPGNYVIGQPARDSHRYFGARASVKF